MKSFKDFIMESGKLKKTLYIHRDLLNASDLIQWAKDNNFTKTLEAKDMHVTQAYSSKKVDWSTLGDSFDNIRVNGGHREVAKLGDGGAVVLKFNNSDLKNRWKELCDKGCSWDFPSYISHVSLTYDGKDMDLSNIKVYNGPLELGPEIFKELDTSWSDKVKEKVHND